MNNANEKFDLISSGANKLLVWEITEAMNLTDANNQTIRTMGSKYIGKQRVAPSIILKEGKKATDRVVPYLIFGSGYDHESDNAGLVIVDMLYRDELNSSCMVKDGEDTAEKLIKEEERKESERKRKMINEIINEINIKIDTENEKNEKVKKKKK